MTLRAAEASLLIANGLVVALGAERARVDARVTSGAANASELLSVNVAIMRAEADQIEARAHRGTVRVRLLTQTGVPLRAVESLDALTRLLPSSVASLDIDRSPLVMFRQTEQMAAQEAVAAARARLFPSLGVRAGVSTTIAVNGDVPGPDLSIGPELGGVLPVLGARRLAVQNAELNLNAAISKTALARREVSRSDQELRLELAALTQSLAGRRQVLSAREELTQLRRAEYEAGTASISDIIDAIEAEAAARNAVVSTRSELLTTRIELLITTGQLQSLFFFGKDTRFARDGANVN